MAWTQFFQDIFIDTAFVSLSTHNSTWASAASGETELRISSNGTSAGASSSPSRSYLASAPANDQAAEITIRGSSFLKEEGLLLRYTPNPSDALNFWAGFGYLLFYETSLGDRLQLWRLDLGTHTQLANIGIVAPADGDVLRGECVGTTIRVMVNGNALAEIDDATYASGTVGIFAGLSFDDTTSMSIDDFTVYQDVGVAPAMGGGYIRQARLRPAPFKPGRSL